MQITSQASQKHTLETNYLERYNQLNDQQKKAVDTVLGPVIVIAGPGSGKTELLGIRTANILRSEQISPHNILLLTFTNSGAQNMRERLVSIIGEAAYKVAIYTFHSFASDIMSRYAEYFFDGASYRPATEVEKLNIIENILAKMDRSKSLSSKHFEKGYTYTRDIMSCISGLKKGNLNGEEFKNKIEANIENYKEINNFAGEILAEISGKRNFEVVRDGYLKIYDGLEKLNKNNKEISNPVAKYLANTLSFELKKSLDDGEHKNLNAWRDEYFTKNTNADSDNTSEFKILKDSRQEKIEKWLELCDVYDKYDREMNKQGLYDFDDMIFKVTRELEKNVNLRNELEEKYQYIMIDEFQDTNEVQFSLVKNLTSSPINEGKPNILAVGDDDQAIYKFQGAELDNITRFVASYTDVEFVTLDKNYRSTQEVLDSARKVITKIEDRLEVRFPSQINKDIKAANQKYLINKKVANKELENKTKEEESKNKIGEKLGEIVHKSFDNIYSEQDYVASTISDLINNKKVNPKEISVISKSHANLKSLAKMMNEHKVPYSYEKKENVLDKQHIRELINIVDFASSGTQGGDDENMGLKEELLPEILSYTFWNIDRVEIWKIAEIVKNGEVEIGELGEKKYKKISWLSAMLGGADTNSSVKIKQVATFLIELIGDAKSMPLEHMLDKIIGTTNWEIDEAVSDYNENKEGEIESVSSATEGGAGEAENKVDSANFTSPYKSHYFGADNFKHNKPEYLEFLFALRTFMGALREYKQGELLYAKDLQEFVAIYSNNDNLSLTLISPFATSDEAVTLQTAHKSKGLEYEYVFIINSDEDEWNGRGFSNKIGMPAELKLLPESDNLDDKMRLYYVSMTRAKHTLYITNNKNKFGPILNLNSEDAEDSENKISKEMMKVMSLAGKKEYVDDEKVLLKRLLENYKMPVTHLTNFLNLGKVGPGRFVEQNLLRFPQAMSASSVYGSAMHEAMQNYYLYFKKYQKLADIEKLKAYFENAMQRGTLTKNDYDKYLKSGYENLEIYLKDLLERKDIEGARSKIKESDMVEVNFANEGVHIGISHASGKIDKMQFENNEIRVTDLKTGKSFDSWEPKGASAYDKIKLHFFKYQLAYYALLIKNSRSYSSYKIDYGYIEFLECDDKNKINILELKIDDELLNRVSRLTNIIYCKITSLNFPDTSKYLTKEDGTEKEPTLQDILDFEEELLNQTT